MNNTKHMTVLVYNGNSEKPDQISPKTFGHYKESYLWSLAYLCEMDWKNPKLRGKRNSWLGIVNAEGIACLKELGWSIQVAHIELGPEPISKELKSDE